MKKILLLLLITATLFGFGQSEKQRVANNIQIKCIGGYKFVIVHLNSQGSGIAIQQIMSRPNRYNHPPHPIKCTGGVK